MKKKTALLQLSGIKETFVIRLELNQKHVEYLKSLIESGVELPPLVVSADDHELIDGRHRLAAYRMLNHVEAKCTIEKFGSQTEKIVAALQANVGGSLPPTEGDISHVMQILLVAGESRKSIIERISKNIGFPPALIKRHLDYVQSNLAKARLQKAVSAVVSHGKTVPEAAAEFGVKLETLKSNLTEKGEDDRATDVKQLKSHLSQSFNKLNSVFGHNLSKVARDLSDGVIKPEEVRDVIVHVNKLTARFNRRHEEWLKRFEIHIGSATSAAEVSQSNARKPQEKLGRQALNRMGL